MNDQPTWHDFARVHAAFKASRAWHVDLADFHRRRYDVYCQLLGIDPSDTSNFDRDQKSVHRLVFEQVAKSYTHRSSPFAGLLIAPNSVTSMVTPYLASINKLVTQEKQIYLDVMADAATYLWGPCPRVVTDADLARFGVDAANEPDEILYW